MAINHNYVWPLGLALIDDLLFVVVEGEEYGIKVYDTSGGKFVTEFGRKGRGPAEYLAYSIQRGPGEGLLEISDASNRKNDIYNVECIRSSQSIQMIRSCIVKTLTNTSSRQALYLNENQKVINHGVYKDGLLWISNQEIISDIIEEVPNELKQSFRRPIHAVMAASGSITASSDRTNFVYFADSFDYALFFRVDSSSVKKINDIKYTFLPDFEVVDFGASSFLETGKNYRGAYTSPVSGKSHYFVLYSGNSADDIEMTEGAEWRSFSDRIHVFNFEGEKIQEIKLDRKLMNIAVDYEESIIYGITYDREMNAYIMKAKIR